MSSPTPTKTIRYPSEFGKGDPNTDYLHMQFIRRNYNSKEVNYKKAENLNDIYINIPQKVTETLSQQFNNSGLGAVAEFFGRKGGGFGAFGSSVRRLVENFALDKSVEISNKLGATSLSAAGLLSASSGVVFNPNLEVLYEGPDFRRFNFQFNLFTKSEEDADTIAKIVTNLRRASLPSTGGSVDNDALKAVFNDAALGISAESIAKFGSGLSSSLLSQLMGAKNKTEAQTLLGNFKTTTGAAAGAGLQNAFDKGADAAGLALAASGIPDTLFSSGGNRLITQPPFILLTYKRGSKKHPFIKPLLPAAINQISFDYTPTGNYTTVGGFHDKDIATTVGVTITMQLTEVTNLFAGSTFDDPAPGITSKAK